MIRLIEALSFNKKENDYYLNEDGTLRIFDTTIITGRMNKASDMKNGAGIKFTVFVYNADDPENDIPITITAFNEKISDKILSALKEAVPGTEVVIIGGEIRELATENGTVKVCDASAISIPYGAKGAALLMEARKTARAAQPQATAPQVQAPVAQPQAQAPVAQAKPAAARGAARRGVARPQPQAQVQAQPQVPQEMPYSADEFEDLI